MDAQDVEGFHLPLMERAERVDGPAPHDFTCRQNLLGPFDRAIRERTDRVEDAIGDIRSSQRVSIPDAGDGSFEIGDGFGRVPNLQGKRAAMRLRTSASSMPFPSRSESTAARRPASSSGDNVGTFSRDSTT